MKTEIGILRDQAGEWRAAADRVRSADPQAAIALNDLAARLDRRIFMLELRERSLLRRVAEEGGASLRL